MISTSSLFLHLVWLKYFKSMILKFLWRVLHHRKYQRALGFGVFLLFLFSLLYHLPLGNGKHYTPPHFRGGEGEFDALKEFSNLHEGFPNPHRMKFGERESKDPHRLVNVVSEDEVAVVEGSLRNVVASILTAQSKCPACFGLDLCEDIQEGELKLVNEHEETSKLFFRGTFKRFDIPGLTRVMVVAYDSSDEFKLFDDFICKNGTAEAGCDVGDAVLDTFMVQHDAFKPLFLKKSFKIAHKAVNEIPNMVCATEGLIEQLQDSMFGPGILTQHDLAMFYTSILVHPEVINHRFFTNTRVDMPFPTMLGSCGRAIILNFPGQPLRAYLNAPWEKRADIVLQILHIIESFINDDEFVAIIYSGFNFDNLYVNEDGKVLIVNAQDVGFIDKNAAEEYEIPEGETCNEDCFNKFAADLYNIASPLQENSCNKASTIAAHAMYALSCRDLFSDIKEHLVYPDRTASHPGRGLLHHIPESVEEEIQDALFDCVHETLPGGRMSAVEELQEILAVQAGAMSI